MLLTHKINKIAFIGMGLINSSLARDLKKNNFYKTSVAYSRRTSTVNKIKKLNLADRVETDCKKAVIDADLIVIGIPVDAYEDVLNKIIGYIKPGAILTDVGSVKKEVVKRASRIIPKEISFVPGHPIAGTEKSGPESGFSGLFKDGWCVLTPGDSVSKRAVEIVKNMWETVGMRVDIMDAAHHDLVLAITSHIPHIIAYSIVGTIADLEVSMKKEVIKYAASGFRDFTRIAASDPTMWRDIALLNKDAIIKALGLFKKDLSSLEKAIKSDDGDFLYNLFSKTRKIRKDIT